MPDIKLKIDGMHCASCVRRVSQALAATPGVQVKEVKVGAARVSFAQQPAPIDHAVATAIAALAKAGYTAHLES